MKSERSPLDIDEGNSHGWTPIMLASYRGWEQIARRLSRQNPQPKPNMQNDQGNTALILAASRGNYSIVLLLVGKLRANVDMTNSNGTTAVMAAAKRGRWAVVRALANRHARVDSPNNDDEIPLHYAIRSQNRGNVSRLLLADPRRRSLTVLDNQGRSPLHIAAETGDLYIIGLLLTNGANKYATDIWGRTPSQVAFGRGYTQAGIALL
ncbi:ankyrin repeat-containing domain protein [Stachybotrys elegans]|uniref:Ankyrin repeat-containing domain protein n=1 Tax=Stachybotrys elegans TaxID=80388 RepID=A0A8K0SPP0_9HYPO|nr:ankyrin repeat-containing domain protein [Stachybotrys elegans]